MQIPFPLAALLCSSGCKSLYPLAALLYFSGCRSLFPAQNALLLECSELSLRGMPLKYKDHGELVSTPHGNMLTPQADCVDTTGYCFRTGFWDSELVSTHRWTVSTPL
ncbi:hypothetical protein Taro_018144 [Colocasia esculenta]|uniref:Uncharacterized protein n=1 Tax=Colocasia esculenta TaxID=4460 RepID=A0A843UI06_COLES|nr:hypothetical protein [Colocasia esculenta]